MKSWIQWANTTRGNKHTTCITSKLDICHNKQNVFNSVWSPHPMPLKISFWHGHTVLIIHHNIITWIYIFACRLNSRVESKYVLHILSSAKEIEFYPQFDSTIIWPNFADNCFLSCDLHTTYCRVNDLRHCPSWMTQMGFKCWQNSKVE